MNALHIRGIGACSFEQDGQHINVQAGRFSRQLQGVFVEDCQKDVVAAAFESELRHEHHRAAEKRQVQHDNRGGCGILAFAFSQAGL